MGWEVYRGPLIRARNLSSPHKSRGGWTVALFSQKSFDGREIGERINWLKNNGAARR